VSDQSHLRIPVATLDSLERQAILSSPEECCGVLLGRLPGPTMPWAEVHEVAATHNSAADQRRLRYAIAPEQLLRILESARKRGLDVVGFYHSHPGQDAIPSRLDLESAWPEVSYLIVALRGRRVTEVRCWRLTAGGGAFREMDIGYS
jgi:proteasome lid subunit RPN8/RPN11